MLDGTVTLTLAKADALVLDSCLARFFGEGSLHDWEDFALALKAESEQWPFQQIRDQLADQLLAENTAQNYDELLETAHKTISAREWDE
jgi:hypothetical protein